VRFILPNRLAHPHARLHVGVMFSRRSGRSIQAQKVRAAVIRLLQVPCTLQVQGTCLPLAEAGRGLAAFRAWGWPIGVRSVGGKLHSEALARRAQGTGWLDGALRAIPT
jgi:hypothetical protein